MIGNIQPAPHSSLVKTWDHVRVDELLADGAKWSEGLALDEVERKSKTSDRKGALYRRRFRLLQPAIRKEIPAPYPKIMTARLGFKSR